MEGTRISLFIDNEMVIYKRPGDCRLVLKHSGESEMSDERLLAQLPTKEYIFHEKPVARSCSLALEYVTSCAMFTTIALPTVGPQPWGSC